MKINIGVRAGVTRERDETRAAAPHPRTPHPPPPPKKKKIGGNSYSLGSKRKFGQSQLYRRFNIFFISLKIYYIFYFNLKKILKTA